ncbi:DUF6221 family protein [Streptomyces sp. NPDC006544]|uniref:DUF6221 family protein n=1 Tax=Streptomyces sp. NPDC006544 TaxID=3154583 RepID=UPI00339EBD71
MPDLHDWISQQIDAVEGRAQRAEAADPSPWRAEHDEAACTDGRGHAHGAGMVFASDGIPLWDCEGADMLCMTAPTGIHVAANDPAAVLRRCAADRRILEIHSYAGGDSWDQYACRGCGSDDTGYLIDHTDDCETLLALAEGYGLTDGERAALDRPEPERPVNLYKSWADQMDAYFRRLDDLIRPTNPTSAVPAALRGPNWKARP